MMGPKFMESLSERYFLSFQALYDSNEEFPLVDTRTPGKARWAQIPHGDIARCCTRLYCHITRDQLRGGWKGAKKPAMQWNPIASSSVNTQKDGEGPSDEAKTNHAATEAPDDFVDI